MRILKSFLGQKLMLNQLALTLVVEAVDGQNL